MRATHPPLPPSPRPSPKEAGLRQEARAFARELELPHRYAELDRTPGFPRKEYRALGDRGWLGPRVPTSMGGPGWSLHDEAVLLEELAYEGGSVFAKLVLQPDFCTALQHAAPTLRDRWYTPLLRGEVLVGNQVTEPGTGSDAAHLVARAERDGTDWVLSGTKSEAAFAADAQAAIVYARSSPDPEGAHGISAFLVPQDLPAIRREVHGDLGERWMRRGRVTYDRVRIGADHLIGQEGKGFAYLMEELTPERALLGLIYVAIARASWEETRAHVSTRQAFGRPLAAQEGVAFPLVSDHARLSAARLWVWDVLDRLGQGEASAAEAALAKAWSNELALEVLDHAIQFHGGRGYSQELPHEQRWRDVRSGGIAHGPTEVLKMLAGRELLGRAPPG